MIYAPTIIKKVGHFYVLWFQISNKYIFISSELHTLLISYLSTTSYTNFKNNITKSTAFSEPDISIIYNDIKSLLEDCSQPREIIKKKFVEFSKSYRKIPHFYKVDQTIFAVNFNSEKLKSTIHPQLEHLEVNNVNNRISFTFDVYHEDKQLFLFKNKSFINVYPDKEFNLLQGKFAMELLCSLNQNKESDWLGTFHASTVEQNNKAAMLIGDSGSGKSTFTALLTVNGFNLVADDITPIKAENQKVYGYPAAISIKSGAFETLKTLIPEFNRLKEVYFNPNKGSIKYLPIYNKNDITKGYNCETIVFINYDKDQKVTILESIEIVEALNILIPESWLEPSKRNAEQFLNWLPKLKCYKLSYSNNVEAINKFSKLF